MAAASDALGLWFAMQPLVVASCRSDPDSTNPGTRRGIPAGGFVLTLAGTNLRPRHSPAVPGMS